MRWIRDTESIVTDNHRWGGTLGLFVTILWSFHTSMRSVPVAIKHTQGVHPSKTSQSVTVLTTPSAVWSLGVGGNWGPAFSIWVQILPLPPLFTALCPWGSRCLWAVVVWGYTGVSMGHPTARSPYLPALGRCFAGTGCLFSPLL